MCRSACARWSRSSSKEGIGGSPRCRTISRAALGLGRWPVSTVQKKDPAEEVNWPCRGLNTSGSPNGNAWPMRIKPPFPTEVSAILHRRRQPVGSTPDSAMPRAALGVAAGARSDRLSGHNGAGRPISSGGGRRGPARVGSYKENPCGRGGASVATARAACLASGFGSCDRRHRSTRWVSPSFFGQGQFGRPDDLATELGCYPLS